VEDSELEFKVGDVINIEGVGDLSIGRIFSKKIEVNNKYVDIYLGLNTYLFTLSFITLNGRIINDGWKIN